MSTERQAKIAARKFSIDVDTRSISYTMISIQKSERQILELPNWKDIQTGKVGFPSAVRTYSKKAIRPTQQTRIKMSIFRDIMV